MTTRQDIRAYDELSIGQRIVVGVDSSDASLAALRWAVEQSQVTGARVEAVFVYQPDPYLNFAYGDYPAITSVPPNQLHEEALDLLRAAVAAVVGSGDGRPVRLVLLEGGAPAKALTQHAAGASMLVVGGSHRRGLGILLGSTSAGCVRHAPCPVVVVPAAPEVPASTGHDADARGLATV